MQQFPTVQYLEAIVKNKKINLQYVGLNDNRYLGNELDHWLSEYLFNKFLMRYVPDLPNTTYNSIIAGLKEIKQTKYYEYRYSCLSFYLILVAESTRVDGLLPPDIQAGNTAFIDLINDIFNPNIKNNPILLQNTANKLLVKLEQPNTFFDDRINGTNLKMTPNNFNLLKGNIKRRIKQIIDYHVKQNM